MPGAPAVICATRSRRPGDVTRATIPDWPGLRRSSAARLGEMAEHNMPRAITNEARAPGATPGPAGCTVRCRRSQPGSGCVAFRHPAETTATGDRAPGRNAPPKALWRRPACHSSAVTATWLRGARCPVPRRPPQQRGWSRAGGRSRPSRSRHPRRRGARSGRTGRSRQGRSASRHWFAAWADARDHQA